MCLVKIDTICGIPGRTTRRRLSVVSGIFLAILCGLMRRRITYFISTRSHLKSRAMKICVRQSGGTIKDSAHVGPEFPYPLRNQLSHRGGVASSKEVSTMRAAMNCQICGKKNRLNAKNTVLHVFTRQPAFSWCELVCDHCEEHQEFFFHPVEWPKHLESVINSKTGVIEEEWVDDKTYCEYLETWWTGGEVRELTDQDEKNIKFLAWLLQHYDTRFFDDPEKGEM